MTTNDQLDQTISRWLEAEAPRQMPDHVLRTTFERTRRSRQLGRWRPSLGSAQANRRFAAVAGAAVVVIAIASGALDVNRPSIGGLLPSPTAERSPTATAARTSRPEPTRVAPPADGVPLGWSSDGRRLLLRKADWNLFIVHADGSETQLTDQLSALKGLVGRQAGATISPDGSRVVFAGVTQEGSFCHYGALFAVSADGGPAELLWESHVAKGTGGGIIRYPTFSPDGTQIAFVDDYCDQDHNVWVMNADGSDAHKIVSDPLGADHVNGLAWSPAGDRIALDADSGMYTFAPDGSDFRQKVGMAADYCWPGRWCSVP